MSVSETLRRIGGLRSTTRRPAAWLVVVAASFFAYFFLLLYCDLLRPRNPGFIAGPSEAGHVVVTAVRPGTTAAAAGVHVGDRIVSFNRAAVASPDAWSVIGTIAEMPGPLPVVVERGGSRLVLTMSLEPAPPSYWRGQAGAILLVMRTAQFLTLLAGVFILWRRPGDPVALTASWFLLTCGVFTIAMPWRVASVWRQVPAALGLLMFIPYASGLTIGPVLLTFVAGFPRRLSYAGHVQAAIWAVTAAVLAVPLHNFVNLVYGSGDLRPMGPGTRPLFIVTVVSLLTSVAIFVAHYRHIDDLNERRKLRAVLASIGTAVLSAFPVVGWYWYERQADLDKSLFESPALVFAAVGLLSLPLSITYTVMRHRIFGIGFIIRQGLRYALARRLLLSLLPALMFLLAIDVLAHGHETVHAVLRQRGPLYLTCAAFGVAVYVWRQRWLDALDLRFFRERQDGYAMLRDVAEQLRRAGSLDRVAARVVATIEAAMHPEFASLLAHARNDSLFRTIASAPAANAIPDLSSESKLVALARVLEQPIDTSGDVDVILKQLPAAELEFVARARLDLLIPVMTPDNQLYGLLALGRKRSEEPYSREDKNVLVTIAESVALLAARSIPVRESPALEECLECGECFDAGVRICDRDSRPLVSRLLPRTLAGRYRLDRRIATGGMGTIYEAQDTALERQVAVKVVREELMAASGAAERFFVEARLAARLVHANVVTVHDFGIVEGRQPFLVMERLIGRTLRKELEENADLSAAYILSILAGVCTAVDNAHRLRLVHRDLKPENIFLVRGQAGVTPKILDFGIAKPLITSSTPTTPSGTRPGMLIGTPEYMAPEQLRGEPPNPAWDVWSLAIIALEVLSTTVDVADVPRMPRRIASHNPTEIWNPAVSLHHMWPSCEAFFSRALSLVAAERPQDAWSFYLQLEHALLADGVIHERSGRRVS